MVQESQEVLQKGMEPGKNGAGANQKVFPRDKAGTVWSRN